MGCSGIAKSFCGQTLLEDFKDSLKSLDALVTVAAGLVCTITDRFLQRNGYTYEVRL